MYLLYGRSVTRSACRLTATLSSRVSFLTIIFVTFIIHLPCNVSGGLVVNPIERLIFQKRLDSIRDSIGQKNNKEDQKVFLPNYDKSIFNGRRVGLLSSVDVDIVVIFPGAGGPDQFTDELQSIISNTTATSEENNSGNVDGKVMKKTMVHTFDWREYRGSPITAAFDGEAVGEAVAHSLWKEKHDLELAPDNENAIGLRIKSVHSIGISVGAFASQAFASTICQLRNTTENDVGENSNDPQYVRLTLLDPFCTRGIWGINYGATHFGAGGIDFAEQYLNTDDPVPTTNDPLPLCACVDVTGAPERESFVLPEGETMHCWPLVYFARYGYKANMRLCHGVDGVKERGTVVIK